MTTAAEVRTLVAPIVARHDDLVLIKRRLIIKPVRHLLRFVNIDRTGDKDGVNPFWNIDNLARPDGGLGLGIGSSWFPNVGYYFSKSQPDLAERLRAGIEDFALPTLRPVLTIADFNRYANDGTVANAARLRELPLIKIYVDIALGDLDSAADICRRYVGHEAHWRKAGYADDMDTLEVLRPLLRARDKKALAGLLHQWELAAVKLLKLESLWEPSPFPIEAMD
jgi:hypothetical protein